MRPRFQTLVGVRKNFICQIFFNDENIISTEKILMRSAPCLCSPYKYCCNDNETCQKFAILDKSGKKLIWKIHTLKLEWKHLKYHFKISEYSMPFSEGENSFNISPIPVKRKKVYIWSLKNIYYQHLSLVFIFSRLVYSRNKSINQYVKVINAEISLNLDYWRTCNLTP